MAKIWEKLDNFGNSTIPTPPTIQREGRAPRRIEAFDDDDDDDQA